MIFIVGAHGAGKTHLADSISKLNFDKIDLGPILRKIHTDSGTSQSFSEWVQNGEKESGPRFTDDLLVAEINRILGEDATKTTQPLDYVITGSRSVSGLKYLLDNVRQPKDKGNAIIFLDAPVELLYERYKKREGVDITIEQFQEILEKDKRMGVEELKSFADFVIVNDSSSEFLIDQALNILDNEFGYQLREHARETKIRMN